MASYEGAGMSAMARGNILFINGIGALGQIPMGVLGLCDYLAERELSARVLNLQMYSRSNVSFRLGMDQRDRIDSAIHSSRCTHVGLILHWKETAQSVVRIAQYVKQRHVHLRTVAGGMTASYFNERLLQDIPEIDHVVWGDAELPLLKLLEGRVDVDDIPNCYSRSGGSIVRPKSLWRIPRKTLEEVSLTRRVDAIFDYGLYLDLLERTTGFPVTIGRGCYYNCQYCGGSARAFRLLRGTHKPIIRSAKATVRDLKILLTRYRFNKLFICYDHRPMMMKVMDAISTDKRLKKKFYCNYSAYSPPTMDFIEKMQSAFLFDDESFVELSPETTLEAGRATIRDRRLFYSNRRLIQSIDDLTKSGINAYVFFSYFHRCHTRKSLRKDRFEIFKLKRRYAEDEKVHIVYFGISADVGSDYYERLPKWDQGISGFYYDRDLLAMCGNYLKYYPSHITRLDALSIYLERLFEMRYTGNYLTMTDEQYKMLVEIIDTSCEQHYGKRGGQRRRAEEIPYARLAADAKPIFKEIISRVESEMPE